MPHFITPIRHRHFQHRTKQPGAESASLSYSTVCNKRPAATIAANNLPLLVLIYILNNSNHVFWKALFWRARHSAGQCTRSKAFDKSRLTIQIGTFALESLSKTKCVVTKCSSTRLPPRKSYFFLMLFFWLMRFQLGFHPSQNHVCKKFVKQSYGCNRAVFWKNLSTHGFRQHFERCFPPISWYLSNPHHSVNEKIRHVSYTWDEATIIGWFLHLHPFDFFVHFTFFPRNFCKLRW